MEVWNEVIRSFANLLLRMLSYLGIREDRKELYLNKMKINIRFNNNTNVVLDLKPEWTVAKVKELLSSKLNTSPEELRMIFAGKELDDSIKVEECDVSQHSIIHVVQVKGRILPISKPAKSCRLLSESVVKLQISEEEKRAGCLLQKPEKVHFFVYCNGECKDVCPGKLRVRCKFCKQGTLTVSKDPSCWDDVLLPDRIPGICQSSNCPGNIAEFYFKCASHSSTQEETAVVLYLVKNNFRNITCLSCTEISSVVLVFPCKDGHVICLDCFHLYCLSRLDERTFIQDEKLGYTLPCPVGCENSLIKETYHFRILGEAQYARYQRFGAEECLLQSGGVLCPRPGCGAGILPDPECRRIVCVPYGGQGCGYVFCRQCLQGYHIGPCDEEEQSTDVNNVQYVIDETRVEHCRWDEASKEMIKSYTKPCPKCRTPTERDGGCMHMVCPRPQCNYHWCWICQTEWNRECMGNHWFG